VFDDQHSLWTNVFASVYIYSSQDTKRIGLRHLGCNTSKEDIKYAKKSKTQEEKKPTRNSEEIHEVGSQLAHW
jgi:phage terminase large subunit-like protein